MDKIANSNIRLYRLCLYKLYFLTGLFSCVIGAYLKITTKEININIIETAFATSSLKRYIANKTITYADIDNKLHLMCVLA